MSFSCGNATASTRRISKIFESVFNRFEKRPSVSLLNIEENKNENRIVFKHLARSVEMTCKIEMNLLATKPQYCKHHIVQILFPCNKSFCNATSG